MTSIARKHTTKISKLFNSLLVAEGAMHRLLQEPMFDNEAYSRWHSYAKEAAQELHGTYSIPVAGYVN